MPRPYAVDMYRNLYNNQLARTEADRKRLVLLARAVLLFHRGGQWTPDDQHEWQSLTGSTEATSRVLCDLARRLLAQEPPDRPTSIEE